jgi:HK97 gp10 family phage protein
MANIRWYGNRVFTLATEANVKAMHTAAMEVEKDVKTHFTLEGSGMTVRGEWKPGASRKKTKSNKRHMAAAPGKPPAIDVGILRTSIMSEVEQHGLSIDGRVGPDVEHIASKAPVGTNVEYGYFLELGTSKMRPRPFLRPAIRRTRKRVVKIFRKANS